jgi:hypothetical protein
MGYFGKKRQCTKSIINLYQSFALTGVSMRASSAFDQTVQPIRSKRIEGEQ